MHNVNLSKPGKGGGQGPKGINIKNGVRLHLILPYNLCRITKTFPVSLGLRLGREGG
jgi:hypothetical protein